MLKLICKTLINNTNVHRRHISLSSGRVYGLFKSDKEIPEASDADFIDEEIDEIEMAENSRRVNQIRNKSRLLNQHRNMLYDRVPYANAESWIHNTLKYKRKLYAKYGADSNVDPRICFYTQSELAEKAEYENVAFPHTVLEMVDITKNQRQAERDAIMKREAEIYKNLEKLETWKKDIEMRKEKKETEARLAKERKDRLIEEVRRHFGYTIDTRDERFKEMLEQKEKEQRKALKETKRQAKESKLMAKLIDTKVKPSKVKAETNDY